MQAVGVVVDGAQRAQLVDADGTPLRLRPTVARLWDALVADRGSVVGTDELIRRTWGDRPPTDAQGSLLTTVARLRRVLPDGAVRRDGDGYVLDLPVEWQTNAPRRPHFVPAVELGTPLVGREAMLDRLRSTLRTGRGIVLHGDAGVGKSRLLEHLVGEAAAAGRDAAVLRGRSVGMDVPLGVYAPLLREVRPDHDLPVLLAARAALVGQLDGAVLVLGLDDLHQIDPLSAVLTAQLVHGGHALLIGTHRSTSYVHSAIADLWHEGRVMHIHVPELDRPGLAQLAVSLGRPVGDDELDRLWRMTQGNPLFAGVLLRHPELDVVHGDPTLEEVIADQLAGLSPELYDTLTAVAIAEPVRLEVLEQVVDAESLLELERAGLIRLDQAGPNVTVRVRHPLYGEHVRAGASRLLARSIRSQLADAVDRLGAADPQEQLRQVRWALDGGRSIEPAVGIQAARHALHHDDLPLARRLAESVWQTSHDVDAAIVLAEAAFVDRPGTEVAAIARNALPAAGATQAARLRIVAARAAALKDLDPEAADELLAPIGNAGVAVRAQLLAYQGRGRDALAVVGPLDEAVAERRIPALVAAATALTQLGRAAEALELLDTIVGWLADSGARGRHLAPQIVAATSRPLMVLGRLREAEMALRRALDASRDANDHLAGCMNAVALGGLLPFLGRPTEALTLARDAADRLSATGHRTMQRWALMSAGFAAVGVADERAAAAALDELATLPTATMTDGVEPLIVGGLAASRFRRDEAIRALLDGADLCERRELIFESACALHDVARLGGEPDQRLARMAATHGGFPATFAAHAAAIACGDADALADAGDGFDGHGAVALAAEAYGRAAERAAATGRLRRARQLAAEASDRAERCDPGVVRRPLVAADAVTNREREISEMAARGWTNQAIGEHLGISPRTVENHLSRVFQKLDVDGRPALAALLGVDGRSALVAVPVTDRSGALHE